MTLARLFARLARPGPDAQPAAAPFIAVGLGNPGPEYQNTRHNVGLWCIRILARRGGAKIKRAHRLVSIAETSVGGQAVILAEPRTFVNESGRAVAYLLRRFAAESGRLIIVADDMNLEPGRLRIRREGSAGGHNGLKSIVQHIGTQSFTRIRIGIGRPSHSGRDVEHVLGTMPPGERNLIEEAAALAADAVELTLEAGIESAMNKFN